MNRQADLRAFLRQAGQQGKIMEIQEPTPILAIPQYMLQAEKEKKVLFIRQPEGFSNPLVYNVLGSREAMAMAFDCSLTEVTGKYLQALDRQIQATRLEGSAPVQDIVLQGDAADVSKLPLIVHAKKDGGRYISAGTAVCKDPETGIQNVSFNRMQLKGPRKLGFRINQTCHMRRIYENACRAGRPLEVAVVIGNHPMELLAASSSPRFEVDEYDLASALRGEPLELVHCKTVDLWVPANAEIVIEGIIPPGVLEEEGPFGEFKGCYIPHAMSNVLQVTAITMRKDAIFQTMRASSPEDMNLLGFSREAAVLKAAEATGAQICGVSMSPSILGCVISMKKRFNGEPKNVLLSAFGVYAWLKLCVVVDEDVDIFDLNDVWWAIVSRSRPDQDTLVISEALGLGNDPYHRHQSKLGIDATFPVEGADERERTTIPLPGDGTQYPL